MVIWGEKRRKNVLQGWGQQGGGGWQRVGAAVLPLLRCSPAEPSGCIQNLLTPPASPAGVKRADSLQPPRPPPPPAAAPSPAAPAGKDAVGSVPGDGDTPIMAWGTAPSVPPLTTHLSPAGRTGPGVAGRVLEAQGKIWGPCKGSLGGVTHARD